ncbi:hypothetical protein D1007_55088 [Hordeum vulgare]|nr:hypothetical protein D1007_55088 [Hordeum vulgare]
MDTADEAVGKLAAVLDTGGEGEGATLKESALRAATQGAAEASVGRRGLVLLAASSRDQFEAETGEAEYIDDFVRAPLVPTRGSSFTGVPFGIPQPVLIGLTINQASLSAVHKGLPPFPYGNHPFNRAEQGEAQTAKAMVKILEIGGARLDTEDDDDCCEIDPAEFARKVNLKATHDDDVVVVAAKGPIKVKVEVDWSEHSANGGLHERIAGDKLDNPYKIEEDEPAIHQMETVEAKPDVKSIPGEPLLVMSDTESPLVEVGADMLQVKHEPEDDNGADEHFAETVPEVQLSKSVYDMSPVKCETEDGISGADEHEVSEEEVIPEMPPAKRESECFEEVVIPDILPGKCETEDRPDAVDEPFEEETIPGMPQLKCGSGCSEEVVIPDMSLIKHAGGTAELSEETIPDKLLPKSESEYFEDVVVPVMSPIKHEPEDDQCVGEDGYDHLPEMDRLNLERGVFDEEDGDYVVVVAKEAL